MSTKASPGLCVLIIGIIVWLTELSYHTVIISSNHMSCTSPVMHVLIMPCPSLSPLTESIYPIPCVHPWCWWTSLYETFMHLSKNRVSLFFFFLVILPFHSMQWFHIWCHSPFQMRTECINIFAYTCEPEFSLKALDNGLNEFFFFSLLKWEVAKFFSCQTDTAWNFRLYMPGVIN